jgi:hypothetical protein
MANSGVSAVIDPDPATRRATCALVPAEARRATDPLAGVTDTDARQRTVATPTIPGKVRTELLRTDREERRSRTPRSR